VRHGIAPHGSAQLALHGANINRPKQLDGILRPP
jgi:hypothetical protein